MTETSLLLDGGGGAIFVTERSLLFVTETPLLLDGGGGGFAIFVTETSLLLDGGGAGFAILSDAIFVTGTSLLLQTHLHLIIMIVLSYQQRLKIFYHL